MFRHAIFTLISGVAATAFLSGCASIMHGASQDVGISSNPSDAQVIIDGKNMGATPMTTKLSRGKSHTVKLALPGYATYSATFTKHVSGWVWGNLLFGGIIGLAVDAGTGGLYYLTPNEVSSELIPKKTAVSDNDNGLYVFVTLKPDPSWQRIGKLTRSEF